MSCTHFLKPPGQDRCRRCRWWDEYLQGWYRLERAIEAAPLVQARASAAACRRRFSTFVKEAWAVVRPGTPLVWTWYLEALCDHVQWLLEEWRRSKREIGYVAPEAARTLLVSVPPGSGKTLVISVLAPAWMWIDSPEWSCLCLSVNPMVARDAAVDCRALVKSQWYRSNFVVGVSTGEGRGAEIDERVRASGLPDDDGVGPLRARAEYFDDWADAVEAHPAGTSTEAWSISEDRDTMGKFITTRGGYRASQGMTAQIVGARADCLFIDDPNDPSASSDEFWRTNVKYENTLYHRVNSLAVAGRVIIQQRLDPIDLTGFVLRTPGSKTHLCLPLLHEPERTCRTTMPTRADNRLWLESDRVEQVGTWCDPRTMAGQVLSKKRWPPGEVTKLRAGGSFGAICQQDPDRAEGEHFEEKLWGFWVKSTASAEDREAFKKQRPLGCDLEKPAMEIPVDYAGRLGVAKVWVTDDPTGGSTSDAASHVGLLICAEAKNTAGEQVWLVVHDCDPGPRSPAAQLQDLDRAIRLAASMTKHDRVRVLVEDKSSGKAHAEDIEKHLAVSSYDGIAVTCELYKAGTDASKEDRDVAVLDSPHASGRLLLPDGAIWLQGFVRQFRRFPRKPNDKVDALGQLVAHTKISSKGWGAVFLKAVR